MEVLRYRNRCERPLVRRGTYTGQYGYPEAVVIRPQTVQTRRCIVAQSKLDEVVSLAKRRGFVFPAGEIYGGTRSAWDYGPLGVALKDNIKREWWRSMVVTRPDVVGVDTSIILPPEVWVASGHVSVFNDPLVECLNCHKRNRADKLEVSAIHDDSGYRKVRDILSDQYNLGAREPYV